MKIVRFSLVILVLCVVSSLYGVEKRVLIVPFLEKVGDNLIFKGDTYSFGVASSVWPSVRLIEGFYFEKPTNSINFDVKSISTVVSNNPGYNFYFIGKYEKSNGKVIYSLELYNVSGKKVWGDSVEMRVVEDEDLFVLADSIALKLLAGLLGREVGFANIVFKDFEVGDKRYFIEINNKRFKEVGDGYGETLKVPSGQYEVVIRDANSKEIVKRENFVLVSGEGKTITFSSKESKVYVFIKYKERGKENMYSISIDDIYVDEGEEVEVIGDKEFRLVIESPIGVVYSNMVYIPGGSRVVLYPYDKFWGKELYFKVSSGNSGMITLGFEYFFHRYWSAGCNLGFTPPWLFNEINNVVLPFNVMLISRYYIWGDGNTDLKFSGFGGGFLNILSMNGNIKDSGKGICLGVGGGYSFKRIGIPLTLNLDTGFGLSFFENGSRVGPYLNISLSY